MGTKDKIKEMLVMQDEMNKVVHPQWREQGYEWYRAGYVEAVELLDHHGQWKWWKKGSTDLEQLQLELVDIWHFMLSHFYEQSDSLEAVSDLLMPTESMLDGEIHDFRELVDIFVGTLAMNKHFSVVTFYLMMNNAQMDFDDLYLMYVGKNTLNKFRQQHGYKDGSYIKTWFGDEDNVVLSRIMAGIDESIEDVAGLIHNALSAEYAQVQASS